MLQFIVLGLVPGTHLQITFGWLLGFVLSIAVVVLAFRNYQKLQTFLKTPISLRYKKSINKPSA